MSITKIDPAKAKPVGSYSMGMMTDSPKVLFMSGQVSNDKDGNLVGKGDIEAQAEQVYQNLKDILEAAGASFKNVASITTFLTDQSFFQKLAPIRAKYFQEPFPASTGIVISSLASKDYLIEVEAVAVLD
ncbi:MAG: RidA family protein [Candidatus Tectomicrobia bacterium]|nr:RidA family protein [Candidatus Tectomicrobia bacterium]